MSDPASDRPGSLPEASLPIEKPHARIRAGVGSSAARLYWLERIATTLHLFLPRHFTGRGVVHCGECGREQYGGNRRLHAAGCLTGKLQDYLENADREPSAEAAYTEFALAQLIFAARALAVRHMERCGRLAGDGERRAICDLCQAEIPESMKADGALHALGCPAGRALHWLTQLERQGSAAPAPRGVDALFAGGTLPRPVAEAVEAAQLIDDGKGGAR